MNGTNISYGYNVRDAEGNVITEKQVDEFRGHFVSQVLKPGDEKTETILLSAQYDFSHPGKYVIQLSRRQKNPKDGVVKSNKITITVSP